MFTGVETDQDTVYRVRQEDWTEGGSKIGWYPSFPTYVDVVSGARAGSARTAAQPVAGRATAGSVPVTFKDVASTTAAETFQWRPSLWDYGWTYGESLTDGPSRGSDPVGWWVDWADGTGRAAKHNGGVMLDTQRQNTDEQPGSRGTTAMTMRGNPMKYGRWEVRMRTKSTENHAYDPHVLIELVPDDPADYHCGAQTITVADFTPHGSERGGRRQGAGRREEVDPDGARRVEERQLHGVRGRGDPGSHHVVHRGQGGRDRQEPGGGLRRPDDAAALAGRTWAGRDQPHPGHLRLAARLLPRARCPEDQRGPDAAGHPRRRLLTIPDGSTVRGWLTSIRRPTTLAVAVQGAVDAVTRLHHQQEVTDLASLLRQELSRRGVDVDDEEWLDEAVGHIRDGHPLVVDEAD